MNKNILIVDDDKRLRELLKDYLTEKNLEIYLSKDYEEAKDILSVAIFDLIILIPPKYDFLLVSSLLKERLKIKLLHSL